MDSKPSLVGQLTRPSQLTRDNIELCGETQLINRVYVIPPISPVKTGETPGMHERLPGTNSIDFSIRFHI